MLITRKEKQEIRRYELDGRFVVEVIITLRKHGHMREFWLSHEDICIKEYMFGLYDVEEWQEPLYIDTDDTCSFIEYYKSKYMED